jgi:hypothetical protein
MPDNKVSLNVQPSISGTTCCNSLANLSIKYQLDVERAQVFRFYLEQKYSGRVRRGEYGGQAIAHCSRDSCDENSRFWPVMARWCPCLKTCFVSVTNNLIPGTINVESLPISVILL